MSTVNDDFARTLSPKAREMWERVMRAEPMPRVPELTAEEKAAWEEVLEAMKGHGETRPRANKSG